MDDRPTKLTRINLHEDEPGAREGSRELASIASRLGPIQGLATRFAGSAVAGKAHRRIDRARVAAEERIARTAITMVEERVRRVLVANATSEVGALTVDLQARTAAVMQSLTNAAAAEVASHFINRNSNAKLGAELLGEGIVSEQEYSEWVGWIQQDLISDITDSRARMEQAKVGTRVLHDVAVRSPAMGIGKD